MVSSGIKNSSAEYAENDIYFTDRTGYSTQITRKADGWVTSDLTINLTPGTGPEVTDGTNTLEWSSQDKVSEIWSGLGDDSITGDDLPNRLVGNSGSDTIWGGGGNDEIKAHGGYYSDAEATNDHLYGEEGNDSLSNYGVGPDHIGYLYGGGGWDSLYGSFGGNDYMYGGEGDDRFDYLGAGDDHAYGGPGEDYFLSAELSAPWIGSYSIYAVDGESDIIYCSSQINETVEADAVDVINETSFGTCNTIIIR